MIQGGEEWLQARCGRATASEFSSVLSRGSEALVRKQYIRRIVAERLTGKPMATYATGSWAKNLLRGTEQEPFARMSYEEITGSVVHEVGFIPHPTLMAGCSPDGLIRPKGGAEIKSVIPTVQLETILKGGYPTEHTPQIQGCMWIGEVDWWDFCSYSPDMPQHLRTYIFRVKRDDAYIKNLQAEVTVFLSEVDELVAKLNERKS